MWYQIFFTFKLLQLPLNPGESPARVMVCNHQSYRTQVSSGGNSKLNYCKASKADASASYMKKHAAAYNKNYVASVTVNLVQVIIDPAGPNPLVKLVQRTMIWSPPG